MIYLLDVVLSKYNKAINEYQALKEILYRVQGDTKREIKEWLESNEGRETIIKILNPGENQPTEVTSYETFIQNWLKDDK